MQRVFLLPVLLGFVACERPAPVAEEQSTRSLQPALRETAKPARAPVVRKPVAATTAAVPEAPSAPMRSIAEERLQTLTRRLDRAQGAKVLIEVRADDAEAAQFAKQISGAFLNAGWEVSQSSGVFAGTASADGLHCSDYDAKRNDVVTALIALEAVGLKCAPDGAALAANSAFRISIGKNVAVE